MDQVKAAAEASAELAQRMKQAGNWSALQQAKEQAFYSEAIAQFTRAKQITVNERENLIRLMGLSKNDVQLPDRLPNLPVVPQEYKDIESQAINSRIDIQMAKQELQGIADNLGLTKATRFINVLEIGYLNNSGSDKPKQTGYEIDISIPLFDWGDAKVKKSEMIYMQAAHRMAETAINARSEVREAYSHYVTAYDLVKHYRDEIVPLRKKISEENLLRYNGMLIGVFDLLADAREQITSVNSYIEALRDFWVADSALQMAMVGKSTSISRGKL
jgi:outer membrane protein TolC